MERDVGPISPPDRAGPTQPWSSICPGHAIGLSALLALPILAGTNVAVVSLMMVLAALAIGLVSSLRASQRYPVTWLFSLAGFIPGPAYLLATTQVYPDLISGLVIANIVMIVALIEPEESAPFFKFFLGHYC